MAPQINVKSYVCYSELGTMSGQAYMYIHFASPPLKRDNRRCKCGWKYIM